MQFCSKDHSLPQPVTGSLLYRRALTLNSCKRQATVIEMQLHGPYLQSTCQSHHIPIPCLQNDGIISLWEKKKETATTSKLLIKGLKYNPQVYLTFTSDGSPPSHAPPDPSACPQPKYREISVI